MSLEILKQQCTDDVSRHAGLPPLWKTWKIWKSQIIVIVIVVIK